MHTPEARSESGEKFRNRAAPAARHCFYNDAMPLAMIIVIGWIYVTLLVAANEPSVVAGIVSFLFYGALPCGLVLYFAGARVRRERRKYREQMAARQARDPAREDAPAGD